MYSRHIFIFPFEWKGRDARTVLFERQTELAPIHSLMMLDKRWKRVHTDKKPASKSAYNETVYFYDFVRPALFDSGKNDALVRHYEFDLEGDEKFVVKKSAFQAELDIVGISCRFYAMGVGAMIIELANKSPEHADPESILKINQYCRRLFPPFYTIDYPTADDPAYYLEATWDSGLNNHPELPDFLGIRHKEHFVWEETYQAYRQSPAIEETPGFLKRILPPRFFDSTKITPVLDDRMFVLCWYANDALANTLKSGYEDHDWWYRFLFVDVGRTVQNAKMMTDLSARHTYPRWSDWGTLFGVTRYAFVCLTSPDAPAFLQAHTRTLYARMAEHALIQRACVLRFSDEISQISALNQSEQVLANRMESLFRQHLRFINKIYFREVTAQEQGIELYDLLRGAMRLEEQVKALEHEISELNHYAASLAESIRNAKLDMMTYIGAYLAVPGFIASYYSAINFKMLDGSHWGVVMALFLGYALLVWLMMRTRGQQRLWVGLLLLAMVFFALFGIPSIF